MKKVTTLFSAALFALLGFVSVQAQTILDEGLRGDAAPANWTATDMEFRTSAGGYSLFNETTSQLVTSSIDLSTYSSATLTFAVAKFSTGDDGPLEVEFSTDGGTTWDAQTYTSPTPTSSTYETGEVALDAAVVGESDVMIRFSRPNSLSAKRLRDVLLVGPDGETIPEAIEVATISALRNGETDGETRYKLTGEAVINFYDSYQNRRHIADTSAAIFSIDPNGYVENADTIGVGITNLIGTLSIENNGAVIQFTLDAASADSASITSTDNNPMPTTTTVSDLTLDETGSLVRVNSVTFQETGTFDTGTNYTLEDGEGNTLTLRTDYFNADYIGEAIPEGSIDVVGVVGGFGSSPQIVARSSADFFEKFDITFQADMNGFIDSAAFIPGEDFVTIPGSINGWDTAADTLTDSDGDNIYTKTLTLSEGDYFYKYHIYSNTTRIAGGYEGGDNRAFTVSADDTLAAGEPNLDYADLTDAVFADVDLNFSVNMSVRILGEEFDPETETLTVTGGFNGWDTTADTLTPSRDADIYQTVVSLTDQAVPATFYYKFTTTDSEGTVTWESPSIQPLDGDNNRPISIAESDFDEGEDKYITNNDYDGEAPFWSDVTDEDIFTESTTVTFEVDMRPAYYTIADSGALPAGLVSGVAAEEIAFVAGNGPLIAGNWESWGPSLAEVEGAVFNDDGESGDVAADDSVFTLQKTYAAGRARLGTFKLGAGGYDNEGGTGADHNVRVGDDNKISLIFGAVLRADSVYDDFYDEYILATEEGPVVVRRGGSGDNGVIVSNEDEELVNTPEKFELSQNYPNPFNPSTNINFTLPQATQVSLTVYNILGQQVARLVNGRLTAGQHTVRFDASNLASGMYLYRIEAGTFIQNKKMMLIK